MGWCGVMTKARPPFGLKKEFTSNQISDKSHSLDVYKAAKSPNLLPKMVFAKESPRGRNLSRSWICSDNKPRSFSGFQFLHENLFSLRMFFPFCRTMESLSQKCRGHPSKERRDFANINVHCASFVRDLSFLCTSGIVGTWNFWVQQCFYWSICLYLAGAIRYITSEPPVVPVHGGLAWQLVLTLDRTLTPNTPVVPLWSTTESIRLCGFHQTSACTARRPISQHDLQWYRSYTLENGSCVRVDREKSPRALAGRYRIASIVTSVRESEHARHLPAYFRNFGADRQK